ncbi:MAG: hypothetical protein LBR70_04715 [Lactobacillaceae bacterium]|nr:hypothetical protein [Lactobacillaceae bacterium]
MKKLFYSKENFFLWLIFLLALPVQWRGDYKRKRWLRKQEWYQNIKIRRLENLG